jgi:hypothetical protein
MSDFERAHRAEAWLTVSNSSEITVSFFSSSHSSFFITIGSEMWSEYLRMIDFSFHDDSSSSSPSRRCRMMSVPRLGLSIDSMV